MAPILPKSRKALSPVSKVRSTAFLPVPSISAPALPAILSVAQLTRRITSLLEREIGEVRVEGEISNFRRQSSGHCYFTLKDSESQLPCVLFARAASLQTTELRDGMQVCLGGELTVYMARGQYQLIVHSIEATGEGALRARFEELKRRLGDEGLFDLEKKRPLPRFPARIGVVTSPTGAALQDFLSVLHRRHPGLSVVIAPARVQGKGAAEEIANAIREFSAADTLGHIDIIVVTRGGGSLEDLWEFNEEVVARAITASSVPVVSAVGHEIDFTIADLVADLRAPTPSAAAELIAADAAAIYEQFRILAFRIGREADAALDRVNSRAGLAASSALFREPQRRIEEAWQGLDRYEEDLSSALDGRNLRCGNQLENLAVRLRALHPGQGAAMAFRTLESCRGRWEQILLKIREREWGRMNRCDSVLAALDPAATLRRGFSITRTVEGRVVTDVCQVKEGDLLRSTVAGGEIRSVVRKD